MRVGEGDGAAFDGRGLEVGACHVEDRGWLMIDELVL